MRRFAIKIYKFEFVGVIDYLFFGLPLTGRERPVDAELALSEPAGE